MKRMPLFLDFANLLRGKIETGDFVYGEKLPTEIELSKQYGMDRKTIRKAKKVLTQEGLIQSIQGKGTFICKPRLPIGMNGIDGFTSISIKNGFLPISKLLLQEKRKAGKKYAEIFQINENDDVLRILRVRQNDELPIAIEDTYLPYHLIPNVEKYNFTIHSLMHVMLSCGIQLNRVKTSIHAGRTSDEVASVLKIKKNIPIFEIEYITYDINECCVEYTTSYTPDNRIIFVKE